MEKIISNFIHLLMVLFQINTLDQEKCRGKENLSVKIKASLTFSNIERVSHYCWTVMIILIGSKTNKQAPATRATLEEKILMVLGTSLVGGPLHGTILLYLGCSQQLWPV